MWTGDGKVFFFHPVTKTSIWERPKELEDNTLVDDILKKGPALLPDKEKSSIAADSEMNDTSDNQKNKGKVMFSCFFTINSPDCNCLYHQISHYSALGVLLL